MNDPIISQIEKYLARFNRAVGDAEKWYTARITELIRFRDAAQSSTTKGAMNSACELTSLSSKIWELIHSEANSLMIEFANSYRKLATEEKSRFESEIAKTNQAFADLTESLIYKTYKPDYKEFHKDTAKSLIVSALKKIDMLSILDDIEALREIDPNYKLPKKLQSGDEVIAYVENYGEQVVEWAYAAKAVETSAGKLKKQLTRP